MCNCCDNNITSNLYIDQKSLMFCTLNCIGTNLGTVTRLYFVELDYKLYSFICCVIYNGYWLLIESLDTNSNIIPRNKLS